MSNIQEKIEEAHQRVVTALEKAIEVLERGQSDRVCSDALARLELAIKAWRECR